MSRDFHPVSQGLPHEECLIDWIAPDGRQINGGYRLGNLWFHGNMYVYYEPVSWRYVAGDSGRGAS